MRTSTPLGAWRLALMEHSRTVQTGFSPTTAAQLESSPCEILDAAVPGNLELDLIRAGKLPEDLFYGTNILETQRWETTHLWYFTRFRLEDRPEDDAFLHFGGIDTAAEIFVDGKLLGQTENMLIPYEFPLTELAPGTHELVVHITPAAVYAGRQTLDASCRTLPYNYDALTIRKAPSMYGWDIMPRCVSAGLWRPVTLEYRSRDRLEETFVRVARLSDNEARLIIGAHIHGDDAPSAYTVRVRGVCRDSEFRAEKRAFSYHENLDAAVASPYLWWPRNYGDPDLYDTEISLLKDGQVCDTVTCKVGLRTVSLERTSFAGPEGTFRFRINGKKIFVLGTNWVPTDPFPSRQDGLTLRGLELVRDLGCNMIRCWGGNIYPGDVLFDYCDRHGILVWQDFSMACGMYPQDARFCRLLRQEAESVVRRLRDHACLALWSGDNECDQVYKGARLTMNGETTVSPDANDNVLTRQVLPEVIARLDGTRPYLPSSPYLDETAFPFYNAGRPDCAPAEDHLWGPRDYFKGDFYYKNSVCHFASETGYHGCPSPETLDKILPKASQPDYGDGTLCTNPDWLVHAASPETDPKGCYAYRIPLMTRQVERLFGKAPADIRTYALESQISQAEAMKFFVEHFRIGKWYRTGIIWWNVIDGWPQISDAVVDWYGTKKLAYFYLKTVQTPFCLMCDEPDETGSLTLCAANDTRQTVCVRYTVTELLTGRTVASGSAAVPPDETARLCRFPEEAGAYYRIDWTGDCCGSNHFTGRIGDGVRLEDYRTMLRAMGYEQKLEGFGEKD